MNKFWVLWILTLLIGCQPSSTNTFDDENNEPITPDSSSVLEVKREEPLSIADDVIDYAEADSKILERVRQTYEWYFASNTNLHDFPVTGNDTMFTSIDWTAFEQRVKQLNKTGYFADIFIENYRGIAQNIDQQLKTNAWEYYVGYYPPYGNGANPWCNCQDYPDDFWKTLKLENLKINKDQASGNWKFGDTDWNHSYQIRLTWVSGTWKISYLEGFDPENWNDSNEI